MISELAEAFIVGLLLAAANYVALWFTVRRLIHAQSPALLAFASFLSRTATVGLGFYMATGGAPAGLAACVLGFLLMRAIAVRRMAPAGADGGGTG